MGATRAIGAVLLVLCVPALLAAMLLLFSENSPIPPFIQDSTDTSGYVMAGLGAVFLLAGIILLIISPRKKQVAQGTVFSAPAREVEIKRTEMNWGQQASVSPTEALQAELDAINQKIGQAKVRYGVGDLSGESYKMVMEDYEKQRAEIQRRILESQR